MSCKKAPEGWYCSREEGHEGPCAAHWTGPQLPDVQFKIKSDDEVCIVKAPENSNE